MELRQLRTFQTVANLLNFHQAAHVLHYSQSTVSAQIHALEEDLNTTLFDRLPKRIMLTEAGQRLLQYTERILSLTEETVSGDGNGPDDQYPDQPDHHSDKNGHNLE